MTDAAQPAIYAATLVSRRGGVRVKDFPRLIDAILWLAKEFDAAEGSAKLGEVHRDGALVWRKAAPDFATIEARTDDATQVDLERLLSNLAKPDC
jgi:hypothetical protein